VLIHQEQLEAIMSKRSFSRKRARRTVPWLLHHSLVLVLALPCIAEASSSPQLPDSVTQGRLKLAAGHLLEARQLCHRALQGRLKAEALACLGEVELARTEAEVHLAIELGTAALKIRGTIAVRLLLAGAYLKRGSCELAREHLERVLFIDPDHYAAQQMLSFCQAQANSTNKGSP